MKSAIAALTLLTFFCAGAAHMATMDIANCDDLVAAAEATSEGDVEGQLSETEITCDGWTTVEVAQNRFSLTGQEETGHTFTGVRFAVAAGAALRVEVPAEFTGDTTQEVNGGVLHVADSGYTRFFKPVSMHDVGVTSPSADGMVNGGCIYNEGIVRFEDEFTAKGCKTLSPEESAYAGNGGALWNGAGGKVVFKGPASMIGCGELPVVEGFVQYPGLDGGAIYTLGQVSFFEDAEFVDNEGEDGGAIGIGSEGVVKFLKRAKATFDGNRSGGSGGHVYIDFSGSLVLRNTGLFTNGLADGSGGAISTDGEMLFVKHVDFLDNTSGAHGGAIATNFELISFLPEDATYEGNSRTNGDFDFECDNVYINGDADGGEDGFICLPFASTSAL
ncbi:unnamed protein product [Pylaiella littoralis]